MPDAPLSPERQNSLEACFAEVEKNIVGEARHEEYHRLPERLERAFLGCAGPSLRAAARV